MIGTAINITLTPFTTEHYGKLISWIPDGRFLLQWGGPSFTYPLTVEQIEKLVAADNLLCYTVKAGETVIGHAEIRLDERNNEAALCRVLIGKPSALGKGYCIHIINTLLKICFTEHNINRVKLNVFDFNHGAIKCYEKAGFAKYEFIEKGRKYKNEYLDYWKMSINKREWETK